MSTIELIVARGRTVVVNGKSCGPGESIKVSRADAEMLISTGAAHRQGETPTVPHVVVAMKAVPEGMTQIGRVGEHHALAADRGRFFTQR